VNEARNFSGLFYSIFVVSNALLRQTGIGSAARGVTGRLRPCHFLRFVRSFTGPSARFGMTSCVLSGF